MRKIVRDKKDIKELLIATSQRHAPQMRATSIDRPSLKPVLMKDRDTKSKSIDRKFTRLPSIGSGPSPSPLLGADALETIGLIDIGLSQMIEKNLILNRQQLVDEQRLVYYIKLLFNEKKQVSEFIYAVSRSTSKPYNLSVVPFEQAFGAHYYTISREKVIRYDSSNTALEVIPMREWLREKLRFNQLTSLDLVRKFRKIKTLKNWIRNIRRFKKSYASKLIELKLPILDSTLCRPLLEYKARCFELEQLNYFYLCNDKHVSIDELRQSQDDQSEVFQAHVREIDRLMNLNVEQILRIFDKQMWDAAFADLSDELKGGLSAIECPDPSIYLDDIPIAGEQLSFFHKLMSLNVPYKVKSKMRNLCHKILTLPEYFDSLKLISLLNCHQHNVGRLQDYLHNARRRNDYDLVVWLKDRQGHQAKKCFSYVTVYFHIDESYTSSEVAYRDIPVEKNQSQTLSFDITSNYVDRGYQLSDVNDFDMSKLVDYTHLHADLTELTNKAYILDRQQPDSIRLKVVDDIRDTVLKISPSYEELRAYITSTYDDMIKILSSFSRSSTSGTFNLFYKILYYWENENAIPEYECDSLTIENIVDEKARKQFDKLVLEELAQDYREAFEVYDELASVSLQHWRNSQIHMSDQYIARCYGFLISSCVRCVEEIEELVDSGLQSHMIVGPLIFSFDKIKSQIASTTGAIIKEIEEDTVAMILGTIGKMRDWLRSSNELLGAQVSSLFEYVKLTYHVVKMSRQVVNTKVLLNEFDDIYHAIKQSSIGARLSSDVYQKILDASLLCDNTINKICGIEASLQKVHDGYEKVLKMEIEETIEGLTRLFNEVVDGSLMAVEAGGDESLEALEKLHQRFTQEAEKLDNHFKCSTFLQYDELHVDASITGQIDYNIKYRKLLWQLHRDCVRLADDMRYMDVKRFDIKKIDQFLHAKEPVLKSLVKNLPPSSCLAFISGEFKKLGHVSPLIKAIVSPYLRDSHLEELKKVYARIASPEVTAAILAGSITVGEVERLEVEQVRNEVIAVANKAYHEDFLTNKLKELKVEWAAMQVPMGPMEQRTEFVGMVGVPEFNEKLEDALQTISKILSNKHVTLMQREAEDFQKNLAKIQDIVDRLAQLQAKFLFFDDLFLSPDLKKHLSNESIVFENASKLLLALYRRVESRSNAMGIWRTQQLEDHLAKVTAAFDQLQVNVESHLVQKRQRFGRLYLLTNEEMLDLMGNFYKNTSVFNAYLNKMFDSVSAIKVIEDMGESAICGIVSPNGELMQFSEIPFNSKGALEEVLEQLQTVMKTKIKELIFKRFDELVEGTKNIRLEEFEIDKFAKDNLLQSSLLSVDYFFGQLIVNSVGKGEDGFLDSVLSSTSIGKRGSPGIERLSLCLSAEELNELQRIRLSNFLMLLIKHRDSCQYISAEGLQDPNLFYFKSQ